MAGAAIAGLIWFLIVAALIVGAFFAVRFAVRKYRERKEK
jgi:cytochrome c-type biogenesis protein CcmH/NrfF